MNKLKKLVAIVTMVATMGTSAAVLNADSCGTDCGCAYDDCRSAPCISPTVALGAVAVAAIITIVVHNRKKSSSHSSNGGGSTATSSHSHSHAL